MRENTTVQAFGNAGNNITANTTVATIANPGVGRFRIYGSVRHALIDGLKLTSPIALVLCSAANDTAVWGPIIVDIPVANTPITIALNTATGASDTASAIIYAESVNH